MIVTLIILILEYAHPYELTKSKEGHNFYR